MRISKDLMRNSKSANIRHKFLPLLFFVLFMVFCTFRNPQKYPRHRGRYGHDRFGIPISSTLVPSSVKPLDTLEYYLKIKSVGDLHQLPNPFTSEIHLFGHSNIIEIGRDIAIRIDLHDDLGRHLSKGGDILRIWMVDPYCGANTTGYTIDHDNGSYTGVIKALWRGSVEIKVSIALTKQHIGIALNRIKDQGLLNFINGHFHNAKLNVTEETICTTIPRMKEYNELCNFTSENFGMAWYCGKPKSAYLTCRDWISYNGHRVNDFSGDQRKLVKMYEHKVINRTCRVQVTGNIKVVHSKDILCNERLKKSTWYKVSPVGFFYKNHWRDLECRYHFDAKKTKYIKCLKGRPLIFLGDSTLRYWFVWLTDFLNLNFAVGRWDEIKDRAWQKYAYAENKELNLTIVWAPHELPFYGGTSLIKNLRSVGTRLDEINSNSNAIVVLHWYLHLATSSHVIYREHVRNARFAVERLLERSPDVEIFIKGPHALTYSHNFVAHDYVRRYQEQILFEEFQDLQDRVIYLDEWDMTVGNENIHVHPSRMTNAEMIHQLLSYACFR